MGRRRRRVGLRLKRSEWLYISLFFRAHTSRCVFRKSLVMPEEFPTNFGSYAMAPSLTHHPPNPGIKHLRTSRSFLPPTTSAKTRKIGAQSSAIHTTATQSDILASIKAPIKISTRMRTYHTVQAPLQPLPAPPQKKFPPQFQSFPPTRPSQAFSQTTPPPFPIAHIPKQIHPPPKEQTGTPQRSKPKSIQKANFISN